ncbi:MAG: hypothetical protein EXS68_00020 [Candidatus Ryanbacteria bacterium]|nr:hypothetical protein [Candidatus Ryanbacteria bacterium]
MQKRIIWQGIAALLVVVAGGFYVYTNKVPAVDSNPPVQPPPPSQEPIVIDIKNTKWVTYDSKEDGLKTPFTFQYPPRWETLGAIGGYAHAGGEFKDYDKTLSLWRTLPDTTILEPTDYPGIVAVFDISIDGRNLYDLRRHTIISENKKEIPILGTVGYKYTRKTMVGDSERKEFWLVIPSIKDNTFTFYMNPIYSNSEEVFDYIVESIRFQ